MKLEERIRAPGPKKILALDGGGILGLLSVEVLLAIEELLRRECRCGGDFVLADYFDFVAGTSTGAIIAACIAIGMPMQQVRDFYLENGEQMFDRASLLKRLRYKYADEPLAQKLKQELGADTTLGGDRLKSMLMMVLRNATTDSPWPISNNPYANYNQRDRSDCNLDLPLWQLVRASAAAPTYFPPEVINVGAHTSVFVDGGVTMYNNPAFQAFLMATVEPYNVTWMTGADKILLVSIGTGVNPTANAKLKASEMHLLYQASAIPSALMYAAKNEQDFLCRVFGNCKVGLPLDREVGDMINKKGPTAAKLFTYLRYDADVTQQGLKALGVGDIDEKHVQELDSIAHVDEIQRVGRAVAKQHVRAEHFAGFV